MTPPPQPGSVGDRDIRYGWGYKVGYLLGRAVGTMILMLMLATILVVSSLAALWAIRSALGWCG